METNLTTKQKREQREFETLFKKPTHARAMWAENVLDRFTKPVKRPIPITDKDGNVSPQSQIEIAIYDQLVEELKEADLTRLPTDGEMMEACQAYYSRHNAASYTARRDTMGAKPIDESKNTHTLNNPYENLADDELLVMQEALNTHRQTKLLEEGNGNSDTDSGTGEDSEDD